MKAPIPKNEAKRLQVLWQYNLLDTMPEETIVSSQEHGEAAARLESDLPAAHALLERAVHAANTQGRSLAQILASWPEVTAHLGPAELETVLDPAHYLGASDAFIDAVLARAAAARGAAPQTSPRAQTGSNP